MGLGNSSRKNLTIPILLFLLAVSLYVFLITVSSVRGQSVVSGTGDKWWSVQSYIWNRQLNLWGRTDCTLPVSGQAGHLLCDNSDIGPLNHVRYYHDHDPVDTTPNNRNDDVYGKLRGRAWSPVYGVVEFDAENFPADSCDVLWGSEDSSQVRIEKMQPRIEKVDSACVPISETATPCDVQLVGCAYVPLLGDYILFNRSGVADSSSLPSASDWSGVGTSVVEDESSAYIELNGCAWSPKSSFWSFGPNKDALTDTEQCLPDGHDGVLKGVNGNSGVLPTSSLGVADEVGDPVLRISKPGAKIGQEVKYVYECPQGYASPSITITDVGNESPEILGDSILSFFTGVYRKIFVKPVSDVGLICADGAGIFSQGKTASGFGIYVQDSLAVLSFSVNPSVITEGGFVSFNASVSNHGNFVENAAHCVIINRVTGKTVGSFDVDQLNVSISSSDDSVSDIAVRDVTYDLRCQYRRSADADEWQTISPVSALVKVLPSRVDERNISSSITLPQIEVVGSDIRVSVPSGVSEVYVHEIDKRNSLRKQISSASLKNIFTDRTAFQHGGGENGRLSGTKTQVSDERVILVDTDPETNAKYGSIEKDSVSGKTLIAEARNLSGQWSQKVIYTSFANGICDESLEEERCIPHGSSAVINTSVPTDTGTDLYWRCGGVDGGAVSRTCHRTVPADGRCDNSKRDGCALGVLSADAAQVSDAYYQWYCDGVNGGDKSSVCQFPKSSCQSTVEAACILDATTASVNVGDASDPVTSGATAGKCRDTHDGVCTYTCVNSNWVLQAQGDNSCTSLCYTSLGIISSDTSTTRQGRLEQGCTYVPNPGSGWYVKSYTFSIAADATATITVAGAEQNGSWQIHLYSGSAVIDNRIGFAFSGQSAPSVSLEKDLDAGVEYIIQVSNYDSVLRATHTPFTLTIDPTE